MVSIQLTPRFLSIRIHGWDVLHALRRTLTVPLAHVVSARAHPPEADFDRAIFESWRGVGTYVPGRLAAGSIVLRDGRSFYDVRDPVQTVAIDLRGERFEHIVVELHGEAPDSAVDRIHRALRRRSHTASS